MRVDVDGVNSLHSCCESGRKLKGVPDERDDDVCWRWGVRVGWCNQTIGREECCMSGDAKPGGKGAFEVWMMWSCIDAQCGIVAMT